MAYRRRHGIGKFATFKEDIDHFSPESITAVKDRSPPARSFTSPSSLAGSPAFDQPRSKNFTAYKTETKGLWGVIAQKAKSVIEDDKSIDSSTSSQSRLSYLSVLSLSDDGFKKMDNPKLRKGLDILLSSLNQIGDTFGKPLRKAGHSLRTKQLISSRKHEIFKPGEEELVVKKSIRIKLIEWRWARLLKQNSSSVS